MIKLFLSCFCVALNVCLYAQAGISNDGNYVFVTEDKSREQSANTLIIQSTSGTWKQEIEKAYGPSFSKDSRYIQYRQADSIFTLELGTSNKSSISKKDFDKENAFRVIDLLPTSVLQDLNYSTDRVFVSPDGIKPFLLCGSGDVILFYLQEKAVPKIPGNYRDLWSYTDPKNQDAQLRDAIIPRKYAYCFNKKTSKLIRLEQENEKLAALYSGVVSDIQINNRYAIVYRFEEDIFNYDDNGIINADYSMVSYSWNKKTNCDIYLISLDNGTRKLLNRQVIPENSILPRYWLSPNGKYIVYTKGNTYYSYEIDHAVTKKIATVYNVEWDRTDLLIPSNMYQWVKDDFILVRDSFSDLWKISLSNKTAPVNITNSFFRKAALGKDQRLLRLNLIQISENEIICRVLCANRYMNDGVYVINLGSSIDPRPLIELNAPYQYDFFQKAQGKEKYLLMRQTAQEPPKYFLTADFRTFTHITGDAPDNRPPGIQTEIITWKGHDGKISQGVLYKPRDFDSSKKYPIIFVYYENHNQPHNVYLPYGAGDLVDYDYLVFSPDIYYSLGETGKSALNSVLSAASFLSKKKYVDSKRMGLRGGSFGGYETNYIITHSNIFAAAISGAGYSDFISNIGALDIGRKPHGIEGTGQIRLGVSLWQRPDIWIKNSPIYFADRVTTPLFIVHSQTDATVPFEQNVAFFKALKYLGKKVWMLQIDNGGHIGGSFSKSIVGKNNGNCDMCTMQIQFFNHYLKGEAAPKWMLDGIPARKKGIEKGLELDTEGRTPGAGLRRKKLILTSEQEELLRHRTMVTDDGRIIDIDENKNVKKKTRNNFNK